MQRKRFILTKKQERFKKMPNSLHSKSRILCESGIIKDYNNEKCNIVPMRRYLPAVYQQQLVDSVREQFDVRTYRFANLATFKKFQKQMRLLKKS